MTLTRGARITGTVLSAVLALITAGWIVRDLRALEGPGPLWDIWSGVPGRFPGALPATTGTTLVLLLVQAVTAFAVRRSPVAAAALVTTGVTTLLLRLPGLWTTEASWTDGRYPDELRSRALISTVVTLAAALALVVTAAAGRRPARDVGLPAPTRPTTGASVVAFLALGVSAAVLIAWEIRQIFVFPDALYPDWYLGGRMAGPALVDAPGGWTTVTIALLALFAGVSALAHAVHSRPFGMAAAVFLLLSGGLGVARAVRLDLFEGFSDQGVEEQLAMLSWVFLTLAGIAALSATVRRGRPAAEDGAGAGWGPGAPGYGYPPAGAPGRAPGYGYPYPPAAGSPYTSAPSYPSGPAYPSGSYPSAPSAPGYGYPPVGPGSGPEPAEGSGPGDGYPRGGGSGPPPPSSPPPGR
ncbi:hypothetical protein [Streptomyces sp. AM 2-1-1]|uniref:hypothetical protein n=1 Tax=Streptomyces sp. AM 2-1-1 TaxID=3028709 RepID=UPI0023BA3917|nr:hypothetical protein [Streptomyces sp. AM 2-1-1]WEH39856.1 hypothetical protein PZB77_10180 [Streptomyces sp. AM 2-1-1]